MYQASECLVLTYKKNCIIASIASIPIPMFISGITDSVLDWSRIHVLMQIWKVRWPVFKRLHQVLCTDVILQVCFAVSWDLVLFASRHGFCQLDDFYHVLGRRLYAHGVQGGSHGFLRTVRPHSTQILMVQHLVLHRKYGLSHLQIELYLAYSWYSNLVACFADVCSSLQYVSRLVRL